MDPLSEKASVAVASNGAREIDKYMVDNEKTSSLPLEVKDLDAEEEPDSEEAKQLALQRQENNRIRVAAARQVVADLTDLNPIDGRTLFNSCKERIFRYNYDNGNIKTSFVSIDSLYPRPIEVFRLVSLPYLTSPYLTSS
jgi:hypothetical protein